MDGMLGCELGEIGSEELGAGPPSLTEEGAVVGNLNFSSALLRNRAILLAVPEDSFAVAIEGGM